MRTPGRLTEVFVIRWQRLTVEGGISFEEVSLRRVAYAQFHSQDLNLFLFIFPTFTYLFIDMWLAVNYIVHFPCA